MPEENIGPSPRSTTTRTSASAAAAFDRRAELGDQLAVEGVALFGTVEDEVADRAAILCADQ
jgi:hypothetical protein